MLHSKEIPKCGHRLSFFISYSIRGLDGGRDFPTFEREGPGAKVEVRVSSRYKWIEPARLICFRQLEAGKGDTCVKDGQKVFNVSFDSWKLQFPSLSLSYIRPQIGFWLIALYFTGIRLLTICDTLQVKIYYRCYDIHTHKVRHETNEEHDPEIIGPGENKIREGENLVFGSFGILQYVVYILSGDKAARTWNLCRLV
uniref:Uncharacterized protein n=1 Tax=Populus alba TaxID=43335 RepID=A0A4U5N913_POPAL|nr:hypothetical protein D5086_0000276850 [Populus alba]